MPRPAALLLASHLADGTKPSESTVDFRVDYGDLMLIHLKNVGLTALSFGVYRFWAKTHMRQYLWGSTKLWGDAFEYTGTAKELLLSFVRGLVFFVAVYALFFGGVSLLRDEDPFAFGAFLTVSYTGFVFLGHYASYTARRYRVSHTMWRGLRCNQLGSATTYGGRMLRDTALCLVTFGFYFPYMATAAHRYTLENTRIGSQGFTFEGHARELFSRWVLAWLFAVPSLGLSVVWYYAAQQRYLWGETRFGDVRFRADIHGGELALLNLGNVLLLLVTFGLATPIVISRTLAFFFDRVAILGKPDFRRLAQSTAPVHAGGEGLLDLLDGDIA